MIILQAYTIYQATSCTAGLGPTPTAEGSAEYSRLQRDCRQPSPAHSCKGTESCHILEQRTAPTLAVLSGARQLNK